MSTLPDIIPGWPDPSKAMIELFQINNGCAADGILGPQTRAAMWRERGAKRYTYLAPHRNRDGAAERSRTYAARVLEQRTTALPLQPHYMLRVVELLSSDWQTGFDFLSTQDGITFGARRLAARTLRRFVREHESLFAPHLGAWGIRQAVRVLDDADNNGWPLSDYAMRAGFLSAAADRAIWDAQLRELVEFVAELLDRYPWTRGRTIALACRAANSGGAFVKNLPRDDHKAYVELAERYTKRSSGPRRIRRIREFVGQDEVWR